ncbi:MAG: hypothetical protein AUG82_11030 [Ktedonobacter sp. 13_1_20CM_4_53_11]|nr:MAG: hypothetical protein AUG82_11030 [Ktedonobacter sp. 13_1_20CM_4_53_11]
MESLGKPHKGPACRLFPSLVQVPLVVGPPCWALLVVCRQDEQHTTDSLRPFPAQADPARGRRKEAGQHSASSSREELLEVDAVTALKVVAREHLAGRACLPGESKQAVHVPLLPLQAGRTGADRAREQSLSCMGTRKKACCSQGL